MLPAPTPPFDSDYEAAAPSCIRSVNDLNLSRSSNALVICCAHTNTSNVSSSVNSPKCATGRTGHTMTCPGASPRGWTAANTCLRAINTCDDGIKRAPSRKDVGAGNWDYELEMLVPPPIEVDGCVDGC